MEEQHTEKVRETFASTLIVEDENDKIRKPLDPERFKNRPASLPKTKYNNKIKKQSILDEPVEDAWSEGKEVLSKYKASKVPAIVKPSTGHSYNPTEAAIH